jgi:ERCC4-related helicase
MLNEGEPAPVTYAHHGSLSREIRAEVEKKLKNGEPRAIVATNSLELGIDIDALDEVILLQAPPAQSRKIMNLGGFQPGEERRGRGPRSDAAIGDCPIMLITHAMPYSQSHWFSSKLSTQLSTSRCHFTRTIRKKIFAYP